MNMSPQMMQMMQQMDFSQEKVQQQFSELGLKPEDVISKVRGGGQRCLAGPGALPAAAGLMAAALAGVLRPAAQRRC
jgi:hypothetical protein